MKTVQYDVHYTEVNKQLPNNPTFRKKKRSRGETQRQKSLAYPKL